MLHDCGIVNVGQAAPPCFGAVVMLRARARVPPPHVSVHVDHVSHVDTWQLTVHDCNVC